MKKVKAWISIGLLDGREDIIEYEDDVTDEEIEEDVMIWANNYIEVGWTKYNEGG